MSADFTSEQGVCLAILAAALAFAGWVFHAAADPDMERGGRSRRLVIRSRILRTRWTIAEPSRLRLFGLCAIFIASLAAFLVVLAEPPRDRIITAAGGSISRPEGELLRQAGPPSRIVSRSLEPGQVTTYCADKPADRVLAYDIPSEGLAGHLRKLLDLPAWVQVYVCVDASGTITQSGTVQF